MSTPPPTFSGFYEAEIPKAVMHRMPEIKAAVIERLGLNPETAWLRTNDYVRGALFHSNPTEKGKGFFFVGQKAHKDLRQFTQDSWNTYITQHEDPLLEDIRTLLHEFEINPDEALSYGQDPVRVEVNQLPLGTTDQVSRDSIPYDTRLRWSSMQRLRTGPEGNNSIPYYNPDIYGKNREVVYYGDHCP